MTLTDLRKMTDAELIAAASDIIYSGDLWNSGFVIEVFEGPMSDVGEIMKRPNEEFIQLRSLIDELHYRHIIRPKTSVDPLVVTNP